MKFLYLILNACLIFWFLDVATNPGPQHPVPDICGILCSNVRGLAGNLSDLTVALSRYDILLCSETLVSDMWHNMWHPVLLCRSRVPLAQGKAAYVRDGY